MSMIEHFTEFHGSPNRVATEAPRVTLNKRGVMLLNRRAVEAIKAPAAVVLLFDKNNGVIGLLPAEADRRNAFPVKQKDRSGNHTIHVNPFCRHFKIKVDATVQFEDVEIDEGLMRLDLSKTTVVTHGRY